MVCNLKSVACHSYCSVLVQAVWRRVLSRYDEKHERAVRGAAVRNTNKAAAKLAGADAEQFEREEECEEGLYNSPPAPAKRGRSQGGRATPSSTGSQKKKRRSRSASASPSKKAKKTVQGKLPFSQ